MFTLFRLIPPRQVFQEQIPAMGAAFLIAELFYKFHSFTLECAAFLATWFVLDWLIQKFVRPLVEHFRENAG